MNNYTIVFANGFEEDFQSNSDKKAKSYATRLRSVARGTGRLYKNGEYLCSRRLIIDGIKKRWSGWIS